MAQLHPRTDAAHAVLEQSERVWYLDYLYEIDDRDNPAHPLRGTYTGLVKQYGHNHTKAGE